MRRWSLVGLVGVIVIAAAIASLGATTWTVDDDPGADFTSIQDAIDAAGVGDTINVAEGTYTEALNVNKEVTIAGAGAGVVTINVVGAAHNSSGIYVSADNVHLSGFTAVGSTSSSVPRYGIKYGTVANGSLNGIVVENMYRSGLDFLGTSKTTLTDVVSQNNGGHGLSLCDANDITVTDLTVSGNAWQGVSVVTWGRYAPIGTSGIVFDGINNFVDLFQLEQGRYPAGPPEPISFSTDPADGADVTVQATDFTYALWGDDDDAPTYQRVYFMSTLADAQAAAAIPGPLGHMLTTGRYIQSIEDRTQLHISAGCEIQAATDAAVGGDTIHVAAGTYVESPWIAPGSELTLQGAGRDTTTIQGVVGATDKGSRHTGSETEIVLSGLTFDGGNSYAVKISKYEKAPLDLEIYDSRFLGTWGALWICRNSYAARDPVTGEGTVRIHDNIFESRTGLCMSNSQGYDVYSNLFDLATDPTKGSESAYVGSGCSGGSLTRGDHHFFLNTFMGTGGDWASLDFPFYSNPAGVVHLPNTIDLNRFVGNSNAIWYWMGEPTVTVVGDQIHYNAFVGNTYGVRVDGAHAGPILVDATLNWWGDASGPSGDGPGTGDGVSTHVIYSPWLGIDPDGDPGAVGVQITAPVLIIVDDIGPAPAVGYLNAAIAAANSADLPGSDTIEVRHGTYDATVPITDAVDVVSEVGSATHTILNGPIAVDVSNVLLGRLRQGFTINGPITVGAGANAGTIHINWNDIYGIVTNNGTGTLDAVFNYWGEDGPDTVGLVAIYPLLPEPSDTIIGYMDANGLTPLEAIDYSQLLDFYLSGPEALAALDLMEAFGFGLEEAAEIVDEYGAFDVEQALLGAMGDYDKFLTLLVGYAEGGGGGGMRDLPPSFAVGETVPLVLELVHPVTGEPIDDAVVSYTVCRTLEDGTVEIVLLGVMVYDGDLMAYTFDLDTTGLEPGVYDVYLGTDDGRSRHYQIVIEE